MSYESYKLHTVHPDRNSNKPRATKLLSSSVCMFSFHPVSNLVWEGGRGVAGAFCWWLCCSRCPHGTRRCPQAQEGCAVSGGENLRVREVPFRHQLHDVLTVSSVLMNQQYMYFFSFYWFQKEGKRERERETSTWEGNIDWWPPAPARTGGSDRESDLWPFGFQDDAQSTEPLWTGQEYMLHRYQKHTYKVDANVKTLLAGA